MLEAKTRPMKMDLSLAAETDVEYSHAEWVDHIEQPQWAKPTIPMMSRAHTPRRR